MALDLGTWELTENRSALFGDPGFINIYDDSHKNSGHWKHKSASG